MTNRKKSYITYCPAILMPFYCYCLLFRGNPSVHIHLLLRIRLHFFSFSLPACIHPFNVTEPEIKETFLCLRDASLTGGGEEGTKQVSVANKLASPSIKSNSETQVDLEDRRRIYFERGFTKSDDLFVVAFLRNTNNVSFINFVKALLF